MWVNAGGLHRKSKPLRRRLDEEGIGAARKLGGRLKLKGGAFWKKAGTRVRKTQSMLVLPLLLSFLLGCEFLIWMGVATISALLVVVLSGTSFMICREFPVSIQFAREPEI